MHNVLTYNYIGESYFKYAGAGQYKRQFYV